MKQIIIAAILTLVCANPGWSGGAVVERGEGVFTFEGLVEDWPCLGTDVHSEINLTYVYHMVVTPSGKSVYVETWNPGVRDGLIIDLSTGETWDRTQTVSPFISHDNGSMIYTFKTVFVNRTTGESMMVHEMYKLGYDANGELRVEDYKLLCEN